MEKKPEDAYSPFSEEEEDKEPARAVGEAQE